MPIIAAVDRSNRTEYVVREAVALANAFDVYLHILHVMSLSEFVDLERTSVETENEVKDMDEVRSIAATIADEAAGHVGRDYKTVGLVGSAEDEILRYANETNAEYVVLSPRKRSPTGKALFGSVAQNVVINAKCPVVTVRE